MVQSQHSIGVGLRNEFWNELSAVVIQMHVSNYEEVTLEFMVFFTFEQSWSDEKQFQLLQLIQFEDSDLVIWILAGAEASPPEFG